MGPSSRSEDLIAEARAAVERDAEKWDEGAQWAAVELGAIDDERQAWITPTDNPYRPDRGGAMTARDFLTEQKRLADAATEGPWEVGDYYHVQGASHCECLPHYGPLVWKGMYDINGKMMMTHVHRRPEPFGEGCDTSIYRASATEGGVIALSTSEYVKIAPADAAFIASARTSVPHLVAALEAVLDFTARQRDEIRTRYDMTGGIPADYRGFANACDDVIALIEDALKGSDDDH